jgi:DHA1 family bicyclomycin/chloramphenicol resistance-like MFS transporter
MSDNAPAPRPTLGFIVLLGVLSGAGPMAIDMYLPALPAIGSDLSASPAQTQATVATFLAGMAVGQLFYGPASDRLGRRPPILFGLGVFVLGSVACALAGSADLLLAARFLQGLGACVGTVVCRAVVRDRYDHIETARVLSLLMLIIGIAPVLGPLGGTALMTIGGWRTLFWFMSLQGLVLGLASFRFLQETRSPETAAYARQEAPLKTYLSLFRERRLIAYSLAAGLNGAVLFTYIASTPELVIHIYGIAPTVFSILFSLNAVGLITGNQVNRSLLRQYTPDQVLAKASLSCVALALVLTLCATTGLGGKWAVLALLMMLVASFGFIQGNTMACALGIDPRRSGSISAMLGAMSFLAGAVAAWLAGVLHDGTAIPTALVILGASVGSALLLHLVALPRELRGWPPARA